MTKNKKKNGAGKRLFRHVHQPVYHSKLNKWPPPFTIIVLAFLIVPLSQAHGNGNGKPPVNQAPVAVGTIAPVRIGADPVTVDVSDKFKDADGDKLTYTAASSADAIATAHVDSGKVIISPESVYNATVTVTATDNGDRSAKQTIAVKVSQTPVAVGTIAPVRIGADPVTVDVSDKFKDADGDKLTYTAASSADTIATARVDGSKVKISSVSKGYSTITVTASDPWGLQATQNIAVLKVNSLRPLIKYIIHGGAVIGILGGILPIFFNCVIFISPNFIIDIGPRYKPNKTDKKRSMPRERITNR